MIHLYRYINHDNRCKSSFCGSCNTKLYLSFGLFHNECRASPGGAAWLSYDMNNKIRSDDKTRKLD